jgi:Spy/CpxP family protein refolding chaperone
MKISERVRMCRILFSAALFLMNVTFSAQALAFDQAGAPVPEGEYSVPIWHEEGGAACRGPRKGPGDGQSRMHNRVRHALMQLDLTEAQKTAIHQIRLSLKKNMILNRADLKLAKLELHEQLRTDAVNMGTVELQVNKIEGLKTAVKLNAIKAREEIKSTLTPEQRKKLSEILQISGRSPRHAHPNT